MKDMEKENSIENRGEIVLYQPDENVRIEVRLDSDMETVWLTQAQMAELFQKDQSNIARHIRNVFDEGELMEYSNMQILHNTLSNHRVRDNQRNMHSTFLFGHKSYVTVM